MPLDMINLDSRLNRLMLGAALLIGVTASTASAQWTVVNLHPADPGVFDSYLNGVQGGQLVKPRAIAIGPSDRLYLVDWTARIQAFDRDGKFLGKAWTTPDYRTAASWVDLHPAGASMSTAVSVSNGKQVGNAWVDGAPRASLWSGSAASWVDLTPAGSGSGFAIGASGTQQVGEAAVGAYVHAGRWAGTAGSWVDLNPASATDSIASDTDGTQQVGYAYPTNGGGNTRASLWTGTAGSWVNLHPSAALGSRCTAVHNGQQVGWGIYPIAMRAHLWTGTANSLVNLHPASASQSRCAGVHAGQQVGTVFVIVGSSAIAHAALWSGTAASWVDLHTFLPPGFLESEANDIWHSNGYTLVVGYANNTATMRYEAIMWVKAPPCPANINGDGAVNIDDLLAVINAWGGCPQVCPADIAPPGGNGVVNVDDLLAVINAWGACP